MGEEKSGKRRNELKELQSIRNLLILQLLKSGATLEEIDLATGMGVSHISETFPKVKRPVGAAKKDKSEDGN